LFPPQVRAGQSNCYADATIGGNLAFFPIARRESVKLADSWTGARVELLTMAGRSDLREAEGGRDQD